MDHVCVLLERGSRSTRRTEEGLDVLRHLIQRRASLRHQTPRDGGNRGRCAARDVELAAHGVHPEVLAGRRDRRRSVRARKRDETSAKEREGNVTKTWVDEAAGNHAGRLGERMEWH